ALRWREHGAGGAVRRRSRSHDNGDAAHPLVRGGPGGDAVAARQRVRAAQLHEPARPDPGRRHRERAPRPACGAGADHVLQRVLPAHARDNAVSRRAAGQDRAASDRQPRLPRRAAHTAVVGYPPAPAARDVHGPRAAPVRVRGGGAAADGAAGAHRPRLQHAGVRRRAEPAAHRLHPLVAAGLHHARAGEQAAQHAARQLPADRRAALPNAVPAVRDVRRRLCAVLARDHSATGSWRRGNGGAEDAHGPPLDHRHRSGDSQRLCHRGPQPARRGRCAHVAGRHREGARPAGCEHSEPPVDGDGAQPGGAAARRGHDGDAQNNERRRQLLRAAPPLRRRRRRGRVQPLVAPRVRRHAGSGVARRAGRRHRRRWAWWRPARGGRLPRRVVVDRIHLPLADRRAARRGNRHRPPRVLRAGRHRRCAVAAGRKGRGAAPRHSRQPALLPLAQLRVRGVPAPAVLCGGGRRVL
ncbi:hypothetical protein EV177_009524, partial [Coemansia sp. RSA 1804]